MTVSWPEAVPAALAAMFWLVGVGVPACYALGLRGIAAWCVAPVVPTGVLGAAGVVAGWLKVAWSPLPAVIALLFVTACCLGLSIVLRRRWALPRTDSKQVRIAALAGCIAATLLGSVIVMRGLGTPGSVSWTWDTPFHYNALAHIRDSGDGSSLTLATLGDPHSLVDFYPAGWFDIASLVPQTVAATLPVAANATTGVTAAIVWPLACLFLARQVFGPKPVPLAVTGVLAMGFSQFPWEFFSWGALWPYALGQALIPLGLALVLSVTGLATEDTVGRGRAAVLLVATVVSLGFAHPATVFGLGVLTLFPVGWLLVAWAMRQHRAGRTRRGMAGVAATVVLVAAVVVGMGSTPLVRDMRGTDWRPTNTAADGVGEILLNATNSDRALWTLSAVTFIGALLFCRTARRRWIVAAHLGSGVLFIMSLSVQSATTTWITGFWFNDSHRLAAMLAVTAPLMATAGLLWVAEQVGSAAWFAKALDYASSFRVLPAPRNLAAVAPLLLVGLALLATTKGLYEGRNALSINGVHKIDQNRAGKLGFYRQVEREVPPGSMIANNPEDGSTLLWALGKRRILLPHLTANNIPDRAYLAQHLTHATIDPRACRIARRLHVGYLVTDISLPEDRRRMYPGLQDYPGMQGFQLLRIDGPMRLYRLTACRPGPPAPAPTIPAGRIDERAATPGSSPPA